MPQNPINKTVIRNALLINEESRRKADVMITEDRIAGIYPPGESPSGQGVRIIEASGLWLLPGVIDDHVHFREPGLTHKADIASESAAAAAGGVTSFMEMPNTIPQTVTIEEWERKNTLAAGRSVVNYSFYIGATDSNIEELRRADPTKVPAFKLFLGASTGNMLVSDTSALDAIFSLRKIPVACHCEDEKIIRANIAAYREQYGEAIDPSFHPLIRSREAAVASSTAAVSLARKGGARLHLLHLSTAEETTLLTAGDDPSQKQIIGEACVHHLWFDDTSYASKGNLIKWNPPVRSSSDREALLSAVRKGLIDIIATDHAPHTIEEKSAPYFNAPSGGPTVQHSLVMMLELCHRGELTPELVVRKMCHNPAKLFAMGDRGFIREGYKADLVLVDPAAPWTVNKDNILFKCGWSPLEGTTFRSNVITTFVNGIPVFENGSLTGHRAPEMLRFNR
ncbi:MAG: dihydroorotase [Bacteroidales bacterium]|jgi:dihydroorotase|nr:dihydroorotase [Bacteroidales bacterium]